MSPALEGLPDLLERIEAAAGSDRELDRDLAVAIGGYERVEMHPHFMRETTTNRVGWYGRMAPFYTASADAALALVERLLPGWLIEMRIYGTGVKPVAMLCEPDKEDASILDPWPSRCSSNGANLPLAIIAALLRALLAKASPQ